MRGAEGRPERISTFTTEGEEGALYESWLTLTSMPVALRAPITASGRGIALATRVALLDEHEPETPGKSTRAISSSRPPPLAGLTRNVNNTLGARQEPLLPPNTRLDPAETSCSWAATRVADASELRLACIANAHVRLPPSRRRAFAVSESS